MQNVVNIKHENQLEPAPKITSLATQEKWWKVSILYIEANIYNNTFLKN